MPAYQYLAINPHGEKKKGIISADNIYIAKKKLKEKKLSPIKLDLNSDKFNLFTSSKKKVSLVNLMLFTRQLSTLLSGGVPLNKSLSIINEQSNNIILKEQISEVLLKIEEGYSLSDALREFPQSFDNLYIALIVAGEVSGDLSPVLVKIAVFLEKRSLMQKEVAAALIYPAVLLFITFIIVGMLLVFVVPSVVDQFSSTNQQLPMLTRWLISISEFISGSGLILVLTFCLSIFLALKLGFRKRIRLFFDKLFLSIPYLNKFLVQVDLSRFLSSLSMLRNSNTPIIEAINISLKTISNRSLRESLDFHLIKVNEGDSIASSLSRVKYVPPLVNQMVASGEAAGNLEEMLSKAAEYLDQEFQQTSKIFMGFLEPLVVLIMGGLVAAIVAAVLLPLIDMNSVSLLN